MKSLNNPDRELIIEHLIDWEFAKLTKKLSSKKGFTLLAAVEMKS